MAVNDMGRITGADEALKDQVADTSDTALLNAAALSADPTFGKRRESCAQW